MIGNQILIKYNYQYLRKQSFNDHIFVADYTEQTKLLPIKRSVEFFCTTSPTDIDYFSIKNDPKLSIDGIDFDNSSFVRNGTPLTQCESVFYPSTSTASSWILFCELKYSANPNRNKKNLIKALNQLFKTRYYYIQEGIIDKNNISYLIGSLPMQSEPFANFILTPIKLATLKRKRNIVLRLQNVVQIQDSNIIIV